MPIGLVLGLGAALMWGLTDVSASVAGRRLGSLRTVALSHAAGLAFLAAVALVLRSDLAMATDVAIVAAVVGLAGVGAYLAFFTALRIGPLSVVSPITAAYGGLTVVLAVVLQGERLSAAQAVGAVVATLGVVLAGLIFDGGPRRVRIVGRGVAFSVVALVLFAVMTVGLAGPIRIAGWLPVVLIGRVVSVAASAGLLGVALGSRAAAATPLLDAPSPRTRAALVIAIAAGLLDAIGLVSFAYGLEHSETWLVGLASSFGPAVAVVFAVVFLGERLRPTQWVGLAGIAAGLAAVAIG